MVLTFVPMLHVCRTVSGSDARFSWMDEAYLLDHGVQPWSELPLWIPDADNGIFEVRNDKAIAKGASAFPPVGTTVGETLQRDRHRPMDDPMKAGLPRERERGLLNHAPHPAR